MEFIPGRERFQRSLLGKGHQVVTGIFERSAIPPENDINDKVEGSEEDEGTASHDQDE